MTISPPPSTFRNAPSRAMTARHCGTISVRSVMAEQPAIVLVRQGEKRITRGGVSITVKAGDLVMVPPALPFDLVTLSVEGDFVATLLLAAPTLFRTVATEHAALPAIRTACAVTALEAECLAAFDRAVIAAAAPDGLPPAIVENRVREVLIWLAHKGLRFDVDAKPAVAERVRLIVSQDLARDWRAPEIARALAMSEATFRRRLERQGQSFQEILIDVRMTRALALLQTTHLSIAQIALDVGYDSASRFAARFRHRFSFPPSSVRSHGKAEARLAKIRGPA